MEGGSEQRVGSHTGPFRSLWLCMELRLTQAGECASFSLFIFSKREPQMFLPKALIFKLPISSLRTYEF